MYLPGMTPSAPSDRRSDVVMISEGGPFHAGGTAGSSFGAMDQLRLRRIARR